MRGTWHDGIYALSIYLFEANSCLGDRLTAHYQTYPPSPSLPADPQYFYTSPQWMSSSNEVEVPIAGRISEQGGSGVRTIRYIDHALVDTFEAHCARFGLILWHPDLQSSPETLHNDACRIIFIKTCKCAIKARAFDFVSGLDFGLVNDTRLLMRLYNHAVHHSWRMRFERELTTPGAAEQERLRNSAGKRRKKVCKRITGQNITLTS